MLNIAQAFDSSELSNATGEVIRALDSDMFSSRIRPRMKVAVTVGSRGIDRLAEVLRGIIDWLKRQDAEPYIVPAMGSHGGGTSRGQTEVLDKLGIREDTVGAPIVPGSETVELGHIEDVPVYVAEHVTHADAIVVVNRIKPHTSYSGPYESGLVKMLAVGLGLAPGAAAVHARGAKGLANLVPEVARVILRKMPVVFGVALMENGFNHLKKIEAIPAEGIMDREPALLDEARMLSPGLPFDEADVLVVDRIGKDISGTGMDTRVIGRLFVSSEQEPEGPRINRIVALRLSQESRGNAYGIGLADVTTRALIRSMDISVTQANAMASTFVERVRIPLTLSSDREAIVAAVLTCSRPGPATVRIARIQDTQNLSELWVSEPLLRSIHKPVKILSRPTGWRFDRAGNLLS